MNDYTITNGIQFKSFIALNRYMDREIFKDPKLFVLMVYIALRVKRRSKTSDSFHGINLEVGEFIIGRTTATQDTGLTDAEFRTRIKKLQAYGIIIDLKPTNKFTKGKWSENEFISVNLESPINQQNNQHQTSNLTTTNNSNKDINTIDSISLFVNSFNKTVYPNDNYIKVINAYMKYKGLELKGKEIKDAFYEVKNIFDSQRSVEQAIKFMRWIHEYEDYEGYQWLRFWNLKTIGAKMPEFLAGKLKVRTMADDYEPL